MRLAQRLLKEVQGTPVQGLGLAMPPLLGTEQRPVVPRHGEVRVVGPEDLPLDGRGPPVAAPATATAPQAWRQLWEDVGRLLHKVDVRK
jgi:hypothetical protein